MSIMMGMGDESRGRGTDEVDGRGAGDDGTATIQTKGGETERCGEGGGSLLSPGVDHDSTEQSNKVRNHFIHSLPSLQVLSNNIIVLTTNPNRLLFL